jgi:hypothetical protein
MWWCGGVSRQVDLFLRFLLFKMPALAVDRVELERPAADLIAGSTIASSQPENIRYALRSFSRDTLLGCRPIEYSGKSY